jgi:hypothetical protein
VIPMNNNCKTCKFSVVGPVNPATMSRQLECRAHPPTVQMLGTPQGPQMISFYPPVQAEGAGCGEWEGVLQ